MGRDEPTSNVGRRGPTVLLTYMTARGSPRVSPRQRCPRGFGQDGEGPAPAPQGVISAADVQFQASAGRGARAPAAASVRWPQAARPAWGRAPDLSLCPAPSAVLGVRATQGAPGPLQASRLASASQLRPRARLLEGLRGPSPFPRVT